MLWIGAAWEVLDCFFLHCVGVGSSVLAAVHWLVSLRWKSPCKNPAIFPSIPVFFCSDISTVLCFHCFSRVNLPALTAPVCYKCQAACLTSTRKPVKVNQVRYITWKTWDVTTYKTVCAFVWRLRLFLITSTDSGRNLVISYSQNMSKCWREMHRGYTAISVFHAAWYSKTFGSRTWGYCMRFCVRNDVF